MDENTAYMIDASGCTEVGFVIAAAKVRELPTDAADVIKDLVVLRVDVIV